MTLWTWTVNRYLNATEKTASLELQACCKLTGQPSRQADPDGDCCCMYNYGTGGESCTFGCAETSEGESVRRTMLPAIHSTSWPALEPYKQCMPAVRFASALSAARALCMPAAGIWAGSKYPVASHGYTSSQLRPWHDNATSKLCSFLSPVLKLSPYSLHSFRL